MAEDKEKARERHRRWARKHKEQVNEKNRRYRLAHPDKAKAWRKANYRKHREACIARAKRWKAENREKARECQRKADAEYRRKHPDKCKEKADRWAKKNRKRLNELQREYYYRDHEKSKRKLREQAQKRREVFAADAAAYAEWRTKERMRKALKKGLSYRPKFSIRIPDWATFGMPILDGNSAFLLCNRTDAQSAYAKELRRSRRSWMVANNKV